MSFTPTENWDFALLVIVAADYAASYLTIPLADFLGPVSQVHFHTPLQILMLVLCCGRCTNLSQEMNQYNYASEMK